MKTRRIVRYVMIALVALLVVAAIGFLAWTRLARYPAFPEAAALAKTAETSQGWYVFQPTPPADTGFIFYPGGLVDPAAYAPLMKQLSDQGIMSVIVPMPLDLAIFGANKADEVIAAYPEIKHWIIGGHSLGGSMAAEYVKGHPAAVEGMAFMAAYPADSTNLSALPIKVVSIHGSNDGLATDAKIQNSLKNLPAGTQAVLIEGGNHAQYGNYGPQAGDGQATISREEQQRQTAAAALELANQLGSP
jgi:dienelactone hydrolase